MRFLGINLFIAKTHNVRNKRASHFGGHAIIKRGGYENTYIELQEVEEARFHNFKTFGCRTIRIDKSVSAIARFSFPSLAEISNP